MSSVGKHQELAKSGSVLCVALSVVHRHDMCDIKLRYLWCINTLVFMVPK